MSFSESKPLIKGIKKEDNNCVLSDSKPFIKQEFDNCLNNKNVLKTNFGNNSHKSNLNSNAIDNQMSIKKKKMYSYWKSKKFNKKVNNNVLKTNFCNNSHKSSKKSKSETFFENIRTEPKGKHYINQSIVIKELRVNVSGRLTPEEVQLLIDFKNEGVVRKNRRIGLAFRCLLCISGFTEWQSVEEHIKSFVHINNKCEQNYLKIDSKFVLDLGKNSDIEVLLSRRQQLTQLKRSTKQLLYSKGIRVKNGFGSDAFVCIECNEQPFETLDDVFNHWENNPRHINGDDITMESNPGFRASFEPQVVNSFDSNNDKQMNDRKVNNYMKTFESLSSEQIIELIDRLNKELIKRIKKVDNNCLLSNSKQFIKQKFDKELDFKTNFLNNSHKSNIKLKTAKNTCKERKLRFISKMQSKLINQLRVNVSGGLTPEEVQLLIAFKDEGVVRKHREIGLLFKCLLCSYGFTEHQSVEEHINSYIHINNKCEQNYSQIDSMFALDLDENSDIEVLLSRRLLMRQLSHQTKQHLTSEGVRVKNGYGSDAFVCIECNEQPFGSLDDVFNHLENNSRHINGNEIILESNPGFSASFGPQTVNNYDSNNGKQINKRKANNDMKIFESLSSDQLIDRQNKELSPLINNEKQINKKRKKGQGLK